MKNNVRVYEKRIRFVDIAKQFPHGCISQMAFETAFDLPRHYIYTKDMFKQELIVRWGINLQTGENVFPDGAVREIKPVVSDKQRNEFIHDCACGTQIPEKYLTGE